jgi:glycosyltransferase involved in cell wall biosynthesis
VTSGETGPLFSLILATVGRDNELKRFLHHLDRQTYQYFELVVIDQNSDDRVTKILLPYLDRLAIVHLSSMRGVSKARNVGLRHSKGDIIAFPDDDCWYPPDLLESVVTFFEKRGVWDGLTGRIINEAGSISGDARFDVSAGRVVLSNVWRRACAATLFLTKKTVTTVGFFDEELGPGAGTPWGGAEDIDYPARAIRAGCSVYYEPEICVFHPDSPADTSTAGLARAYSYGAGIGRVWRKQQFPARTIGYYLLRPLGGMCVSLAMGQWMRARYRWAAFQGRWSGLLSR